MNTIELYLLALLITIGVEFLVYWVFIRKTPLKLFFFSVIINTLTQPLANFSYQYVLHNFILIEILVIIAESVLILLLLKQSVQKSIAISIVANTLTAILSFLF